MLACWSGMNHMFLSNLYPPSFHLSAIFMTFDTCCSLSSPTRCTMSFVRGSLTSFLVPLFNQRALAHLDECRVALGLLQDQRKVLQSDPEFAAAVSHVGGALELRWLNASRRAEQEAQRCRDIQDSCVRWLHFGSHFPL